MTSGVLSKNPELFCIAKRLLVFVPETPMEPNPVPPFRHLLNMDPPEHFDYRTIVSSHFTPRAVQSLRAEIERITRETLDEMMDRTECDFVVDISSKIPLAVIAELLGVRLDTGARIHLEVDDLPERRHAEAERGTKAQLGLGMKAARVKELQPCATEKPLQEARSIEVGDERGAADLGVSQTIANAFLLRESGAWLREH